MTHSYFKFSLLLISLTLGYNVSGQLITTTSNTSADQMVRQSFDNDCIQLSNITTTNNGTVNGLTSYGSFSRGNSAFPFSDGFVLTTGSINGSGNTVISSDLNEGTQSWVGDADLENALGISNTVNATVIEFDVVSISNTVSFNYLLASEEYQLDFPCNVADGFALLIKPTGSTAAYQNMAIIPGTNTPVGIDTVHPEIVGQCAAQNVNYFDGLQLGDTNYQGRTVPFTASATVVPNQSYHIKMVVADQFDSLYDTAIFIESGSLTADVDLGPDLVVCTDTTLNADVNNTQATYQWYRNGSPISGATNSSLYVDSTDTYSVQVSFPNAISSCIIQDDIVVTVDPNQFILTLGNYEQCDDATDDGITTFDFDALRTHIASTLCQCTFIIDFYETNYNAINNINPLPDFYTNTTNNQTVYLKITEVDTGCEGITPFDLIVYPTPDAVDHNVTVCADDTDGNTSIDLTQFNDQITSSTGNVITYHRNVADVNANRNPIGVPFNTSNASETIIARVTNPATGCYDASYLQININTPPLLSTDTEFIDGCDPNRDGYATFDLSSVESSYTSGLSGYSTSYHLTVSDADAGINAIPNYTAFDNTVIDLQNVFIRVEDNVTGCASVAPIELFSNYALYNVDIRDISMCEDPFDGFTDIDFAMLEGFFLDENEHITIEFYLSSADQQADTNRIDKATLYTNIANPQRFWVRLITPNCVEFEDFELEVTPMLLKDPIPVQTHCDQDQDLITTINLTDYDDAARGALPSTQSVEYYANSIDATEGVNRITSITSASGSVLVYARFNYTLFCNAIQEMRFNILPSPNANTPTPEIICDNDLDGFYTVDLTNNQNSVSTDTGITFSYHNTLADATSDSNPIANPTSYNAQTETVYIRVQGSNGCPTIVQQSIIVNTLPVFIDVSTYNQCESDGDYTAAFLLNTKDTEILNGQSGKTVSYHLTANDAINAVNPIDKNNPYYNISTPQTIYVRVQNNTDPSCYGTDSFQLEVNQLPEYNTPNNLEVCDDNNDGSTVFDLQPTIDHIRQGIAANLNIAFYASTADAINDVNALSSNYTNIANPQTIIARIGNDALCYEYEQVELRVIDSPIVYNFSPFQECDNDYDGITTFNLVNYLNQNIGPRSFNTTFSWHLDQQDAAAGTNQITNADNFTNSQNFQTVYLRNFNDVSGCYSVSSLVLEAQLPPDFAPLDLYTFCDNDSSEIDLNEITPVLIIPNNDYLVTYYSDNTDATDGVNALPTPYTYNSTNSTLYARLENINTGCYYITSLNIQIQPRPVLPTRGTYDMTLCDDNYDGVLLLDVSTNQDAALGSLDPNTHYIEYFLSQTDAENVTNQINGNTIITDNTRIYTRVTETNHGCHSIGFFDINLNPLPESQLDNHYVICEQVVNVNAATGAAGETYLWSTGATTAAIDISTPGTYNVVITSAQGCSAPAASFMVTQSSSARIDFITKVDFSDPNIITVEVSGDGDYLYVLDNGEPQVSNVFMDVTRGYHDIVVIDINGCEPTPPQRVLIIDYPKFFTPNADGYNDFWQVEDIHTFESAIFYIFDRHGKLLKNFGKDAAGWDGIYNGNPMPSSDYWFVLEVRDSRGSFDVKGHFSLKR